jgi:signal transduction histidine kinase
MKASHDQQLFEPSREPAMTAARLRLIILLLCFIALTGQDCQAERKKRILVLHSYHQGLEWTDNITKGIQSVISPYHELFELQYEYLDTKRNSDEDYMEYMSKFITTKNAHISYELVIVADNTALKLINEGRITFKGNPPVVFCGINNYSPALTDGIEKVTGVVEVTDYRGTIDLMMKLHPTRRHLIVLLDRTPTGNSIREEFRQIESAYQGKLDIDFYRDFRLDEIPDNFSSLGNNDFIYILTFNKDRDNTFISYAEGIETLSRYVSVPLYGSWDFYLGKGIIGGLITSGYLQGEEAGKLALDILKGAKAENLTVISKSPTQYMFDYTYMKKIGMKISELPDDSVVINAPPTPYEQYRIVLYLFTLSSMIVAIFILWRYKQQQAVLKVKHALALELEQKVDERTQELKTANRELEAAYVELKRSHTQILQQEKMASIGQLASGLAHEINTPVQFIGQNIAFLHDSFGELLSAIDKYHNSIGVNDSNTETLLKLQEQLDSILDDADFDYLQTEVPLAFDQTADGVRRVADIVRAMRNFAPSSDSASMESVNVEDIIQPAIEISRNNWQSVAELSVEYASPSVIVRGVRSELGQVILNLILNAADAIREIPSSQNKPGSIHILSRSIDGWGEIVVADNGCGIEASLLGKIFEPFFTTKEVGQGSGYGLAIAYSIVTETHGGEIIVESEPDKGSRFIVRLPLYED